MSPRLRAGRAGRVALALALAVTVASPASANRRPTAPAAGPPGAAGNARVFAAAYADPDGWRDLRSVRVEVRSSGEPGLGLAVRYRPAANRLSLRDGGRWRGSCRPGEATALAGPTGRLYCRHTRVLGSGTGLAVRWFLGVKQVLEDRELELRLRAAERGGASSGWIAGGP